MSLREFLCEPVAISRAYYYALTILFWSNLILGLMNLLVRGAA